GGAPGGGALGLFGGGAPGESSRTGTLGAGELAGAPSRPYGGDVGPGTGEGAGEVQTVKGSMFDSVKTASGKSAATTEGIALPSSSGAKMGDMYRVTGPSGQSFDVPVIDAGPAKWTGRGVDISGPLARRMGYKGAGDFPTDADFKVQRLSAAGGSSEAKRGRHSPRRFAGSEARGARHRRRRRRRATVHGIARNPQIRQLVRRVCRKRRQKRRLSSA